MSTLRIAHVVPTYLPATRYGGPIHSVHGLCRGLASLGHDVRVFTTSVDGPGDSDVPHECDVELDGVHVRYYRSRWLRRLYWAPALERALVRELPRLDIVHLHSVFLWPTNVAARACYAASRPYVLSPRGMLMPELIRQKNALIKTAWLRLIEAFTVRHAARIHFTAELEHRDTLRVFPELPPACIVPNGVDRPPPTLSHGVRSDIHDVLQGGRYCLFLGRIHPVKRIDMILRALIGTPMKLVVCGNDEDAHWTGLERLALSLGVRERLVRLPEAHAEDKWALLQGARMLVLCSVHENFGNAAIEAMSVGAPAVVTDGVGCAELVRASGGGSVCSGTVEALRNAMLALWVDDAAHERASRLAAVHVEDALSWRQIATRMTNCYRRALDQAE